MTRTRLRGLEIGGIQIGIEVPETFAWEWPDAPISDFSCLPRDPDVHVGVRVADLGSEDLGGDHYGVGAWTFEVARDGSDWLLGLSRRGVREQLATFNADFTVGEVLVSREMTHQRIFPLRTPLDEWIVLHRTVARGGLCLTGRAHSFGTATQVQLGAPLAHENPSSNTPHNRWFTPKSALFGRQTVLVREQRGGLRNFRTPWNERTDPEIGYASRVEHFTYVEPSAEAFRECLDPSESAELLVAHSIVPFCDDEFYERVLCNARKIADGTALLRLGETPQDAEKVAPTWELPSPMMNSEITRTPF